jgi:hypothetical protein
MEPTEFRVALALRLFIPLRDGPDIPCCRENCKQNLDRFGYHPLSCLGKGNLLRQRHEVVLYALHSLAHWANMGSQMNAKVSCLGPSTNGITQFKPADLLLSGKQGQECVDVTITSPLSQAKEDMPAGSVPGCLAMQAASTKCSKYNEICASYGKAFTPFSVDVCGMADPQASKLLQRIASRMAARDGDSYSRCITMCRRRISLAVQQAVAQQRVFLLLPSPSIAQPPQTRGEGDPFS